MTPADSLVTPFEFGPVGSRGPMPSGAPSSTRQKMRREKLLEFAAAKLGADPRRSGYGRRSGLCERQSGKEYEMAGHGKRPDHTRVWRFEPDFTMCNCMMSFVEVEVDTETGKVDLTARGAMPPTSARS